MKDYPNPEEVEKIFEEAENDIKATQEKSVKTSMYLGYTAEIIRTLKPIYISLSKNPEDDEDYVNYLYSGVAFAKSVKKYANNLNDSIEDDMSNCYKMSVSASNYASSAATISEYYGIDNTVTNELTNPEFIKDNTYKYQDIFNKTDKELGNIYNQIWQVLYGTISDPIRTALALMRQTIDHFFNIFAPDEDVRVSEYFKIKKEKGKEHQVYRRERITYAIYNHVKNPHMRNLLLSDLNNILITYQILNKFHKRGKLSEKQARDSLYTMKKFLEEFIDPIEFK